MNQAKNNNNNNNSIVPVIIMKNIPLPGLGEQIIVINKESSIVALEYAFKNGQKHIIFALNNDFDKEIKINQDTQGCEKQDNIENSFYKTCKKTKHLQYGGVLCKIIEKTYDIKNHIKNDDQEETEEIIKKETNLKLKILVQMQARVSFYDIEKNYFSFKKSNLFNEEKFFQNNINYKIDSQEISKKSPKEAMGLNFFFYISSINSKNIDNYKYYLENVCINDQSDLFYHQNQNSDLNFFINDFHLDENTKNKNDILEIKMQELMNIFKKYIAMYSYQFNNDLLLNTSNHSIKIDLIATKFTLNSKEMFEFISEFDISKRIDLLIKIIEKDILRHQIEKNIEDAVRQNIEKNQKIYLLTEKGKEISKQLESLNGEVSDYESMEKKLEALKVSDLVKKKLKSELRRLKMMSPISSDAAVIRNYLDWIFDIPFGSNDKLNMNFSDVSKTLNQEHYGMEKVKERILQYLAVDFRGGSTPKSALLLIGPPGVGKTSLSRKIAQALGRKFARISLGGVRDEADIRGHRRTYLGSMPGKIMQAIRDSGASNPLILFDEIDKIGHDFRGDPAAALLEVLDREQNNEFLDHYLDVPFDLSKVLFICTANGFDGISRPLFDRMELIMLSSYSDDEKIKIANDYMIPEQKKSHNLCNDEISFEYDVFRKIISEYTHEAGVRGLEEQISIIMRKVLLKILNENVSIPVNITCDNLSEFLGLPKYIKYDDITGGDIFGVANGLAWSESGGSVLTIECVAISLNDHAPENQEKSKSEDYTDILDSSTTSKTSKKSSKKNEISTASSSGANQGTIKYTGKLGDVMRESIETAFSYIKSNRTLLGVAASDYNNSEIHIHVPEGATPKDGPSAGITIFAALLSLLKKKPLKKHLAMTGEITLTGRILPIGGLKEKLLAAKKQGIKYILIPKKNQRDLNELPEILTKDLNVTLIDNATEAIDHLF